MDFISLLPSFGGVAWTVIAFVVALSIIVFVHEYGHYIVGRWTGIHAEVFSLGFGPVLYSRVDRRGTKWQFAALPFGGFVKFLGDADAASVREGAVIASMSKEEQRHTMHGAPLWARSATVAAGPAFNFIMAILVFAGMMLYYGIATDEPIVGELKPFPIEQQGLQAGDRILALNGTPTPDMTTYLDVAEQLPPNPTTTYLVDRAGAEVTVEGPHPFPPIVGAVNPLSAAMDAGIAVGDVILAVDGKIVSTFAEMPAIVEASGGREMRLKIWRAGETYETTLSPDRRDLPKDGGGFETRWLLGLNNDSVFTPQTRTPGLFESVWLGTQRTWSAVELNLSFMWNIVAGNVSSCGLSGPIGIAKVSGAAASQGLNSFIMLIAMLSTSIGLMNLFPIPVLDGGHLVFHAYEAVTGKPPNDRALRVMMGTGLVLLLSLMVFALSNDLFCP